MRSSLLTRLATVASLLVTAIVAPSMAGPAAAAPDGRTFLRSTTVYSEDGKALPARTYRLPDGLTETVVDPAAVKQMLALAASGCGNTCDGLDPNVYGMWAPDGRYYPCARDAFSPRTVSDGYRTAELRYSPLCRTAWTRGCCSTYYGGFSYYLNGVLRLTVEANGRNTSNRIWTAMLNDADLVYSACFDNQIGGAHEWKCTGRY